MDQPRISCTDHDLHVGWLASAGLQFPTKWFITCGCQPAPTCQISRVTVPTKWFITCGCQPAPTCQISRVTVPTKWFITCGCQPAPTFQISRVTVPTKWFITCGCELVSAGLQFPPSGSLLVGASQLQHSRSAGLQFPPSGSLLVGASQLQHARSAGLQFPPSGSLLVGASQLQHARSAGLQFPPSGSLLVGASQLQHSRSVLISATRLITSPPHHKLSLLYTNEDVMYKVSSKHSQEEGGVLHTMLLTLSAVPSLYAQQRAIVHLLFINTSNL